MARYKIPGVTPLLTVRAMLTFKTYLDETEGERERGSERERKKEREKENREFSHDSGMFPSFSLPLGACPPFVPPLPARFQYRRRSIATGTKARELRFAHTRVKERERESVFGEFAYRER